MQKGDKMAPVLFFKMQAFAEPLEDKWSKE